jgi:hypothetical protein
MLSLVATVDYPASTEDSFKILQMPRQFAFPCHYPSTQSWQRFKPHPTRCLEAGDSQSASFRMSPWLFHLPPQFFVLLKKIGFTHLLTNNSFDTAAQKTSGYLFTARSRDALGDPG